MPNLHMRSADCQEHKRNIMSCISAIKIRDETKCVEKRFQTKKKLLLFSEWDLCVYVISIEFHHAIENINGLTRILNWYDDDLLYNISIAYAMQKICFKTESHWQFYANGIDEYLDKRDCDTITTRCACNVQYAYL